MGFRRAKSIDLRSFGAPASTPRAASMRKLDLGGVPGFCGLAERGYSGLCAFALPAEQSSRLDSVTSYATQRSRVSVSKTDHIFKGVVNRLYDYVSDAVSATVCRRSVNCAVFSRRATRQFARPSPMRSRTEFSQKMAGGSKSVEFPRRASDSTTQKCTDAQNW